MTGFLSKLPKTQVHFWLRHTNLNMHLENVINMVYLNL